MIFVDTHTHLYLEEFANDVDEVISRPVARGVEYLIIPNIDSSSTADMHRLCDKFPQNCFPMMGVHPTSVKENYKTEMADVESQLKLRKYIAIGEIGIDLYWDKTFVKEQEEAFRFQLDLACEYHLPVAIHSRNSLDLIFKILADYKNKGIRGVLHCFPGSLEQAKKAVNMGYYLGIGGVVSYKNATMAEVAAQIPLEFILLETDAPFLTPYPHRGKRNESAYIVDIAEKIANLRQVALEDIAQTTTQNAFNLFKMNDFQL